MVVGGQLFQVEAAERQVGAANGLAVLIHRNDLQKPVCRDHGTVCCGDVLLGIKAEGDSGDLAIHANAKGFILLQHLVQRHKGFLALVVEAGRGFGDFHLLACVHQLHVGDVLAGIHHAVGELNFFHLEFAQVEGLALSRSVLAGGDGVHYLARRVAQGAVQGVDVLQGGDFKHRTGQALHLIHRLVNALVFCHRGKYLAGLADFDDSFLGHVGLGDFDHRHAAFLAGIVLGHIKVNRGAVQHIAVGGLYFNQGISRAVFQLFRRYQIALGIGVERINGGRRRVSEGHFHLAAIGTVNLEPGPRIGDGDAGFRVHLDHLDEALKVGVVDEITVGLAVLSDIHFKIVHQLAAFPALGLTDDIGAVGQLLRLCKAVLIADEDIALRFLGIFIAAG